MKKEESTEAKDRLHVNKKEEQRQLQVSGIGSQGCGRLVIGEVANWLHIIHSPIVLW